MDNKQRILIVDDDKDLCAMLSIYLKSKNFEIDVAYSGEEALKIVPLKRFDLIILDIMMPGIDGYEVCQRLKIQREFNRIPILMLTAKSTEQDKFEGLKTGADAYIFKPFEIGDLFKSITDTMNKSRRAQEVLGVKYEVSFQIESRFSYVEQVNELIGQLFLRTDLAPDEIWRLKLALHELGINAIEHGNKMDPGKQVKIFCSIFDDRLEFIIEDEGEGFDIKRIPDPTGGDGLKHDRGRGIFLVKKLVSDVRYEKNGARVIMVKHLKSGNDPNDSLP